MNKKIIITILTLYILLLCIPSGSAWDTDFNHRKTVHINSSPDGALTNYQIKLTVAYENGMQADFDDIRFVDLDANYINSWLESKTNSNTADFWIKTDVPASGGKDIYMYYGNSSLSSGSSGSNTFVQYHGSASTTFKDSNTVPAANLIYEGSCKGGTTTTTIQVGQCENSVPDTTGDYIYMYIHQSLGKYGGIRNGATETNTGWYAPVPSANTYHRYKIVNTASSSKFYVDNVQFGGTLTTGFPDENIGLFGRDVSGGSYQQWSFLRKYTANEPTTNIGTQQSCFSWLTDWSHRQAISINNTGTNLTYYQYNITLNTIPRIIMTN